MIRKRDFPLKTQEHTKPFHLSEYSIESLLRVSFFVTEEMVKRKTAPYLDQIQRQLYESVFEFVYGDIIEYVNKMKSVSYDVAGLVPNGRITPLGFCIELNKIISFIKDEWEKKTQK